MTEEKVMEQFHYFNIFGGIDSIFDNWAVSKEGDVVNCVFPYAILSIHHQDMDWKEELKSKVWFRAEFEESLKCALQRAKQIIK